MTGAKSAELFDFLSSRVSKIILTFQNKGNSNSGKYSSGQKAKLAERSCRLGKQYSV